MAPVIVIGVVASGQLSESYSLYFGNNGGGNWRLGRLAQVKFGLICKLGPKSQNVYLLFREVGPKGAVLALQISGFEKWILGPKAHDVITSGECKRLAHGHSWPEGMFARLRDVAVDVDRTILRNADDDLFTVHNDRIFTSVLGSSTNNLSTQHFPQPGLKSRDCHPGSLGAPNERKHNLTIGLDRRLALQLRRAKRSDLNQIASTEAVFVQHRCMQGLHADSYGQTRCRSCRCRAQDPVCNEKGDVTDHGAAFGLLGCANRLLYDFKFAVCYVPQNNNIHYHYISDKLGAAPSHCRCRASRQSTTLPGE